MGIGVVWTANQVFYDPATMPEGKSGLVPYPVMTPEGKGGLIPYPVMTPTEGNAIPSPLVPPQTGENLLSNPLIPPRTGENLLPNPLIPPQAIPNQGIGGTLNPNIYMQKGGCEGDNEEEKESIVSNKGNEYDNTPSDNHSTTYNNPITGEPNSSIDILDKNGNIVRRRWFGSDGNAQRDLDYTNHGNPKTHSEWPHEHLWDWNKTPPR